MLWEHFTTAMEGADTVTDKMLAMCSVYSDAVHNPPIKGGCPMLNTAVESDHAFPILRDKAAAAFDSMLDFIQDMLKQGVANGEFRADMDTESIGAFIFSSMEGSIMTSRLTRDNKYIGYAMDNIELLCPPSHLEWRNQRSNV